MSTPRTGGQIVADALVAHGVTHAFGVPGESYLAVLDALHDTAIEFIICRQEGGAAYMAEAWGRLTGDPGICLVTRGPGATNASVGIHAARENSQPMVVLIGQVATNEMGREAFQEIDYRAFLGPITKWTTQVDDVDHLAETLTNTPDPHVYIHCSAGLHRTGFFAYLLLRLMGREKADALEELASIRQVTADQVGSERVDLADEILAAL